MLKDISPFTSYNSIFISSFKGLITYAIFALYKIFFIPLALMKSKKINECLEIIKEMYNKAKEE